MLVLVGRQYVMVDMPNSIIFYNWTPIFDSYVALRMDTKQTRVYKKSNYVLKI